MWNRSDLRAALSLYLTEKLVIDPIKPNDGLFNAAYEHKKEVWAHKAVKDFLMLKNQTEFSKQEVMAWLTKSTSASGAGRQP